jgi:hypothetical protein
MAKALAIVGTAVLMVVANPATAFARDMGDGDELTGVNDNVGEQQPEADETVAPLLETEPDLTVRIPVAQVSGVWDLLASCESSNRWHLIGRTYSGGLQFDRPTWLAYGGGMYASIAGYASREEQIVVAERLRAKRGYQPWPVCSRVVGLR